MGEYIDRQAAIEAVGFYCDETAPKWMFASDAVKDIPTADVVPVVRGQWNPKVFYGLNGRAIQIDDEWYGPVFECSICGEEMIGRPSYCPNCGAKNTGGETNA